MLQKEVKNAFSMGGATLLSYTKSGDKLVVAGASGVARIYAVGQDDQEPDTIDILEDATGLVVASSGDKFAVSSKSGDVDLYSITELKKVGRIIRSPLPVRGLIFTHSDTMLAAAGDDDEVQIGDLSNTEHIIKFKVGDQVHDISYNQRRDFAALSLSGGEIKIYSLTSEDPQIVKSIKDEVSALIFQDDDESDEDNFATSRVEWHPDGNQFAIPCQNNTIKVFSADDDFSTKYTFVKRHSSAVIDLKWSPKGDFLASVDLENKLIVWDASTRQPVIEESLSTKLLNFSWAPAKNGKFNLAAGSENGDMVLFDGIIEEKKEKSLKANSNLFVDGDMADEDEAAESENEDGEADDINLNSDMSDDNNDDGDDMRDFVDDDDGLLGDEGYTIPQKRTTFLDNGHDSDAPQRSRKRHAVAELTYEAKPYSPGSTPYIGDRRYLTINSIGYVSSVKQTGPASITVSFFDQSVHREYHFDDFYGYDLAALTANGLLLGCSGRGTESARIFFRPHDNASEAWEKQIPTKGREILTSVSLSDSVILVCSSFGYLRNFTIFGVPTGIQKTSPIIACATNINYIFTVSIANNRQLIYSMQDLDGRFLQRDLSLPLEITFGIDLFRGIFFSTYGDPVIVGNDGVVLVLSRWRSPLQARWVPLLDADERVKQIGGKGELKTWPLGLHGDNLNCIIVRGSTYPVYPLPLPTELEVRIPLGVHTEENSENPEEELVRAKTMGELLGETLSNEGETFEDDEERLNQYAIQHDRAVLKLIVQACSDEKVGKAWKLAQELNQDKALAAAVKVAERVGLVALVNRINKLREQKMEAEMASQA